jgi:eukaryotic-like serine/threonine-protein kinase
MDKIGKYEILRKVGAGGFATVYEGRDPFLKRRVAIKSCTTDSEDIRERFYREAEIAGNLEHRNIVTVFDFGIENDVPYLVQEFLSGEDLDHRMGRREPFLVPQKLHVLEQIAEGLAYAHQRGVVHRDIKPANIRLLEDGRVKIMDFGIARLNSLETRLTKAGMTVGTAAYLSPEQVRGEPGDRQADVWAWGVLAYELLGGARPFDAKSMAALLGQVMEREPPPLATVWKDCPPNLAVLVTRCLSKDPTKRYAGFPEVLADLTPMVRAARPSRPAMAAAAKDAKPDLAEGETVKLTAEQLHGDETDPSAFTMTADPFAVTSETSAIAPEPDAPIAPASEEETRLLDTAAAGVAAVTAPAGAGQAAPTPSVTVMSVPAPEPPPPASPPVPPSTGPAPAAAQPAAATRKPVTASRPAAAAPPKKSGRPWLLIAAGLVLAVALLAGFFWIVVRPRLAGRLAAPETAAAEAPAAEPAPQVEEPSAATGVQMATLTIAAAARAGTNVSIDGGPPLGLENGLTLQIAPGEHKFTFTAPQSVPASLDMTFEPDGRSMLDVPVLEAAAAPAAATKKPRRTAEPPPARSAPQPAPQSVVEAPPPPPVQRGDLVEAGPGVVRPKLLKPLSADYPAAAKRVKAEARIGVDVLVDENGKVIDTRIAEGGGGGLGFEEACTKAARAGQFQPATKDGVPVKMWSTVYFTFRSK